MALISRRELVFAAIVGGFLGAVAATLVFVAFDDQATLSTVIGGAWMGFALRCAAVMVSNCYPRKGAR